mgnify:CR=1 FL=1
MKMSPLYFFLHMVFNSFLNPLANPLSTSLEIPKTAIFALTFERKWVINNAKFVKKITIFFLSISVLKGKRSKVGEREA